ncbi:MAG: hypothetical protein A3C93_05275 [Candidatus Lloydbacteria bacterium RIFCSPHIGHO2_02_FULL_54_17]|uniref:Pyrrolidone-carboxylate peptidase n=1 Tax=Candidatus Lloydbacteria bacterium RIFCSPHIGHO2_02_FULL_54_17 TaxID=1798664 RepID=A0A1G2DD17_9BACT|nr:MAG: hypothetical protein A2762_00640 [Candidatus Lloydbacteria bacterium RIFCSPHIGHO2_01_FULL_54_11]OGZ11322.1 MAG: hypothetical protein A3C93_05275 [Candidatus Lloydbacteria bacterium RIFCSPHIGHO2_02_FULL_54_17]OGZ13810.1 MAG: hypothetical protein A2948_03910 [Candidatus Lloydbacteria bacterium RIFCSPLOWO2_01_FULL_54_18]OGZ15531.1 MAG: hypothetical protein A3H76_01905 [Candidatus Lloydbacteria bacterium RIFCSPLOWO2_02_FULL_54_12]
MRILLTAYEPFGSVTENITERVADKIQMGWKSTEDELVVLKLPVLWSRAETLLTRALDRLNPDVVVSMGHAEGYPAITVETRYFNIAEGADNQGKVREGGVIRRGGEDFYDTNVDADGLAKFLTHKKVPVVVHGGKEGMTYLCNFAGYVVMRHIRETGREKPLFIFLHLPPDALPFLRLVRGVTKVTEFLVAEARP